MSAQRNYNICNTVQKLCCCVSTLDCRLQCWHDWIPPRRLKQRLSLQNASTQHLFCKNCITETNPFQLCVVKKAISSGLNCHWLMYTVAESYQLTACYGPEESSTVESWPNYCMETKHAWKVMPAQTSPSPLGKHLSLSNMEAYLPAEHANFSPNESSPHASMVREPWLVPTS